MQITGITKKPVNQSGKAEAPSDRLTLVSLSRAPGDADSYEQVVGSASGQQEAEALVPRTHKVELAGSWIDMHLMYIIERANARNAADPVYFDGMVWSASYALARPRALDQRTA